LEFTETKKPRKDARLKVTGINYQEENSTAEGVQPRYRIAIEFNRPLNKLEKAGVAKIVEEALGV
jgi:hypothetical protein